MSSLEVWSLVIASLSLIITVVGLVPLYLDFLSRRKINFELLRFQEFSHKPVESIWSIRVLHPNKPIEMCSVSYNGVKLPWWDNPIEPQYERFVELMSGGNVRIPKGAEKDDAKVVVRDGKKIIRKRKFQKIPIVPA
jgi:hypothetical protein